MVSEKIQLVLDVEASRALADADARVRAEQLVADECGQALHVMRHREGVKAA